MSDHPERVVPLAGASNFRDLGGYRGRDGRALRWRRVYRSEHLGALTSEDHAVLAGRGVALALDFRGVDERATAPYEVPGLRQRALSIEPSVVQRMQDLMAGGTALSVPVVSGLMQELYRGLVNDQAPRFAEFFAALLDADGAVVFHCTAGKDRTGVAAALLLLALGVDAEAVRHDYLLTNALYRPPQPPRGDSPFTPEVQRVLWGVQADFLEAALAAVERDHGGVERYLRQRLGLGEAERRRLEERFLQPG